MNVQMCWSGVIRAHLVTVCIEEWLRVSQIEKMALNMWLCKHARIGHRGSRCGQKEMLRDLMGGQNGERHGFHLSRHVASERSLF